MKTLYLALVIAALAKSSPSTASSTKDLRPPKVELGSDETELILASMKHLIPEKLSKKKIIYFTAHSKNTLYNEWAKKVYEDLKSNPDTGWPKFIGKISPISDTKFASYLSRQMAHIRRSLENQNIIGLTLHNPILHLTQQIRLADITYLAEVWSRELAHTLKIYLSNNLVDGQLLSKAEIKLKCRKTRKAWYSLLTQLGSTTTYAYLAFMTDKGDYEFKPSSVTIVKKRIFGKSKVEIAIDDIETVIQGKKAVIIGLKSTYSSRGDEYRKHHTLYFDSNYEAELFIGKLNSLRTLYEMDLVGSDVAAISPGNKKAVYTRQRSLLRAITVNANSQQNLGTSKLGTSNDKASELPTTCSHSSKFCAIPEEGISSPPIQVIRPVRQKRSPRGDQPDLFRPRARTLEYVPRHNLTRF